MYWVSMTVLKVAIMFDDFDDMRKGSCEVLNQSLLAISPPMQKNFTINVSHMLRKFFNTVTAEDVEI